MCFILLTIPIFHHYVPSIGAFEAYSHKVRIMPSHFLWCSDVKVSYRYVMHVVALSRAALRAGSLRLMATKATTDGITLGSGTYESVQNYYGKVT